MSRQTILDAILTERAIQQTLYSDDHDASHTPAAWVAILVHLLGKASGNGSPDAVCAIRFRSQMIQVAATALAAAESIDRRAPPDALEPLRCLAQNLANDTGEMVFVLPPGWRRTGATGEVTIEKLGCAVFAARATPEEASQKVYTAEPAGRQLRS